MTDTESTPGDISLAGVSMGKRQGERRRRGGRGEKGEEMKREAGGEVEQEEGRRREGGKERSTGQQLPPAPFQLTAGERAFVGL